jgi:hypothetical protein
MFSHELVSHSLLFCLLTVSETVFDLTRFRAHALRVLPLV